MVVNFYLKEPHRAKEKPCQLIVLTISLYGKKIRISSSETIPISAWNTKKQRVKPSYTGSVELNLYLDRLAKKAQNIYNNCLVEDKTSFEEIKDAIRIGVKRKKNQEDIFEAYDTFMEVRKTEKAPLTIAKYKTLRDFLWGFQSMNKYILTFDSINLTFFDNFKVFLIKNFGHTNNTIDKYISTLKTFLGWAVERGLTKNETFKKFKTKKEKSVIIYLTDDELKALKNLDLSHNTRLANVKDIFLFACYTGQRYSDLAGFTWEHIREQTWYLHTKKTKDIIKIPLVSPAIEILNKYRDNAQPLPMISGQKLNLYIKEVCELAGIKSMVQKIQYRGSEKVEKNLPKYKLVSMHTARKTFVTLSMEMGLSNAEVMAITGHSDMKTLQKYSGQTFKVIKSKMNKVWN